MATEKIYKTFSTWLQDGINSAASLLKVLLRSRKPPVFPSPKGEKILVLGTGPSMKDSLAKNRSYFEQNTVMAVNTFALTEEFENLKPAYYVILDPGFWAGKHEVVDKTLKRISSATSWEMMLLVPYDARHSTVLTQLPVTNNNIRLYFVNYVVFRGYQWLSHQMYRNNRAMPQSQNVLVASLFLAVNLGYRKIELFGADHNWHQYLEVNDQNVVCLRQIHFFEDEKQVKLVPFAKSVQVNETFRMDETFLAWAKVFYGYICVGKYAASRGSRIINRSEHSYIDAYEREPLTS